jgi:hypothetical protein
MAIDAWFVPVYFQEKWNNRLDQFVPKYFLKLIFLRHIFRRGITTSEEKGNKFLSTEKMQKGVGLRFCC